MVTIRQFIAGLVLWIGGPIVFELESIYIRVSIGIVLWTIYYLILNLNSKYGENKK